MEFEETMVEQQDNAAVDDALPEDVVEEQDESESLESFVDNEQPAEEETKETESQGTSEPGWIKKRVEKAVQKAVAEALAQQQAEFDKQMAPIREKLIEDEARELVRSGEVKNLETAKELVRLRKGQPTTATQDRGEQPRNDKGQYAPKEDPVTAAQISMLEHQAERIKASGGPDVIEAFQNDAEIKRKVVSGEMDFYDVADELRKQTPKRGRPPAPMRSPNGASGSQKSTIAGMSAEQFAKFDKSLDEEGKRYRV